MRRKIWKRRPEATATNRRTIGEVIALFVAIWFIIAFVLEWGYWDGFGVSYAEIPLSARFLLDAALVWVPVLLAAILLYLVYEVSTLTIMGYKIGDDALPPFDGSSEFSRKINWLAGFFIGPFFYQLVFTENVNFLLIYSVWSWGAYYALRYAVNHTPLLALKNTRIQMCCSIFLAMPLLYCLGFYMSIHDSTDVDKMAVIHYKKEFSAEEKEALVLRNNSDFIIAFFFDSRRLLVIPQDSVRGLSFHSNPGWNVNLLGKDNNQESSEK